MEVAIDVKNLTKVIADSKIISDLSFEVYRGECFGLLGPNGAGKSTTMKTMYGACELSQGELYILGLSAKKSLREIKSLIGVMPQEDGLDAEFSAFENLVIFSSYYSMPRTEGIARAEELLRQIRLSDRADSPVDQLSGGMKRRLAFARALLHCPKVLFLDEPTTGLDIQSRLWLHEAIKDLQKEGVTITLTTHYIEEAEALCDRVAIIDHGKLLALGSPKDLISSHIGKEVIEFECSVEDRNYYLNRIGAMGFLYQVIENRVIVMIPRDQESQKVLNSISSPHIQIRKPSLSDVFLKLSGSQLREGL